MKNTFISILNIPILYFIMGFNAFAFGQTEGTAINGNLGFNQIGTTPINPSAILEMKTTNKGMLLPRLTTAQINEVPSPAQGLMLFDTDSKCVKTYNGAVWECLDSNPPAALTPPSTSYVFKPTANDANIGNGIVADASGNMYVVGGFYNTITLGKTNPQTLTSQGNYDGYFAKYDSNGELIWATQIAGTGYHSIADIAIDGSGNLLLTGTLVGNTIFYSTNSSQTYVTSYNYEQGFVVKYSSAGVMSWYKTAATTNNYNTRSHSVAVDASGNAYITGYFAGNAVFGSTNITSTSNSYDIFIAKLNASDGTFLWAKNAGGTEEDFGNEIAIDGSGNAYITGHYKGTANFGVSPSTVTYTSRGYKELFVAKYNTSGGFLWAKTAGGVDDDRGTGIAVDNGGTNVYVVGIMYGTISFGAGLGTNSVTSVGGYDILLCKYNGNGDFLWRTNAGSTSTDEGYDVALDNLGNSYITGKIYGDAIFKNSTNSDTFPLSSCSSYEPFIAKYSPLGILNWAILATGGSDDEGAAIFWKNNTAYVTGDYRYTMNFAYQQITGYNFSNSFVWRYAE
jgi:Beta-propeller repeat